VINDYYKKLSSHSKAMKENLNLNMKAAGINFMYWKNGDQKTSDTPVKWDLSVQQAFQKYVEGECVRVNSGPNPNCDHRV